MKNSICFILLLVSILTYSQSNFDHTSNRNFGWQYVGQAGFSSSHIDWPSFKTDTLNQFYLAFQDEGYGLKASVMKYNGNTWSYVGQPGFSIGEAYTLSLALNQQGELFVAFQDVGNMGKASVMKYDGNSWIYVGLPGISSGYANFTSLAVSQSDSLFLAYLDAAHGNKASVMKFDGNSWNYVGNPGFSADQAWTISLAVDSNNRPIVFYEDWGYCSKGTVMRYNGYEWSPLGQEGFTNGVARFNDIALSSDDQPYIAFTDGNLHATVLTFNGTTWDSVGNQGFSNEYATYPDIEINALDELYIVYCEGLNGDDNGPTVMKFSDNCWNPIGQPKFALSLNNIPKLAIDQSGNPVVAFSDVAHGRKASVMIYDSVYLGVKDPTNHPIGKFNVYPNPASTYVYIDFNANPGEEIKIEIFALDGQLVYATSTLHRLIKLSLPSLPSGAYIIRTMCKGKLWSKKVINIRNP